MKQVENSQSKLRKFPLEFSVVFLLMIAPNTFLILKLEGAPLKRRRHLF